MNPSVAIVLKGIGRGSLIANTGEVVEIDKGQNLSLQVTSTEEKVFGGDSLFPFYSFIKEKGGKVSIDDATFNLNQLKVTQNATINNSTAKKYIHHEEVAVASGTSATLANTTGVDINTVVAFDKSTGIALTNVGAGTPTTTSQFKVTALGAVTFGAAITNKTFVFSYYVTDATNSASAVVMSNAIPGVNELRWQLDTEDEAGNAVQVNIRAKKVKTSGSFNIDFKRGTASVQKLEFEILEPSDGSKEFVEITITDL